LLDLINDGAVVELRMTSRPDGQYTYNGAVIPVEDDKRRSVKPRLPQLVNKDGISLDKPLAVAREYMTPLPPVVHVETRPVEAPVEPVPETKSFWSPLEPKYNFWKYSRLRTPDTASPAQPIVKLAPEEEPIATPKIPMIPLPAVIVMCLVCLLVGSLIRSLVSESDFVVHLPAGVLVPDGFKELRRVLQLRVWPGRDIVVAIARH
jgi:hypothetical protein